LSRLTRRKLLVPRRKSRSFGIFSEQNPRFKKRNEDAAAVALFSTAGGRRVAYAAVADGISGLPNGDVAARLAVEGPLARLRAATWKTEEELREVLQRGFEEVNRQIADLPNGAGATLTAVVLTEDLLGILHIGDTSCFYFGQDESGDPRALRLTAPDTVVGDALAAGVDEDEVASMHQHALARSLGDLSAQPSIVLNPRGASSRKGMLLLTSDGITDVWSSGELLGRAGGTGDLDQLCASLCAEALIRPKGNGKPNRDNITCVGLDLVLWGKLGKPVEAWAGAAAKPGEVPASTRRRPLTRSFALVLASVIVVALGVYLSGIFSGPVGAPPTPPVPPPAVDPKAEAARVPAKEALGATASAGPAPVTPVPVIQIPGISPLPDRPLQPEKLGNPVGASSGAAASPAGKKAGAAVSPSAGADPGAKAAIQPRQGELSAPPPKSAP
jgi:serine/threonine protein phosphatase PrpC